MQDHIEQLTRLFLKFPGIGARQAKRFAYFILSQQESYVKTLATTLTQARSRAHHCERCFQIYEGLSAQAGNRGLCAICADTTREQSTIIVVEKSADIEAFTKTDYRGLFFVLGGLIPIVQKHVIEGTNATALVERVQKSTQVGPDLVGEGISRLEVILAFPLTPNGDHTDTVIRELLAPYPVTLSSLGRGLSIGTELEYADPASLSASLKKRE
jgi:recombination protein RecR